MRLRFLVVGALYLLPFRVSVAQQGEVTHWSATVAPAKIVSRGQALTLVLDAKIDPGWHIYSIGQVMREPQRTKISVPTGQAVHLNGSITAPEPHTSYDPIFSAKTEYYEGSVQFRIPLIVESTAKVGKIDPKLDVLFQACSARLCLTPKTVTVPFGLVISSRPQ